MIVCHSHKSLTKRVKNKRSASYFSQVGVKFLWLLAATKCHLCFSLASTVYRAYMYRFPSSLVPMSVNFLPDPARSHFLHLLLSEHENDCRENSMLIFFRLQKYSEYQKSWTPQKEELSLDFENHRTGGFTIPMLLKTVFFSFLLPVWREKEQKENHT